MWIKNKYLNEKEKEKYFKKLIWRNSLNKHKKTLHNNIVVVFCTKTSYNYEKVGLSGNKNNRLIKETYLE